jgi:hypothetical protein
MRKAGDEEKDPPRGSEGAASLVDSAVAEKAQAPSELPRLGAL